MIMRIPGVGSQYLMGFLDADKNPFDGAKTYKCTLPKGIPAEKFWSFTLYDNQSRSMLATPQRYPRRKPDLSVARRRGQCRRIDDDLLQSHAARRSQTRQLDSNDARQGLVHDPAAVQPNGIILYQDVAA